jgi:WhiB family transcriptional regulator, redox-sensing transcriptional regulator
VSQKIDHEMVWNYAVSLAKRSLPVCNHTSVISVGRPDSVSQTEIRSFVRIEMAAHQNSGDIHDQRNQVRRRSMSYEHLRGLMGGTPHTTTGSPMIGVNARPHLSLVPDAVEEFELAEATTDQWQDRALCAQTDPEAFFPEKGGSTREAKKICLGCEVRAECLDYALAHDERFGIWGGLSERERRRLKRGVI